jgi:hypothetical protein
MAHAFDVRKVRSHAGADAGNDEGVGETALKSVASGIFDRQVAQRDSVFDKDIGKDFSLRTKLLAVPQGVVGIAFDEALIGEHCASVNVDADETSIASDTKGESRPGIVAEDVEADREFDCGANGAANGGHGGDGFGSDVCFGERNIAEVFDEERVSAAAYVGLGVGNGGSDYFFPVASPARRAGEGMEVDDTDEKLVTLVKKRGQNCK